MKRTLSLVLALALCLALGVAPASAEEAPYVFTMMGGINEPIPGSDTEQVLKLAEEKLNLDVQFIDTASSAYEEQLQITLAGGDYPDLLFFPDHTAQLFIDAVADGIVIPLNDYLADCPNIMEYSYEESLRTLQINKDGLIYGVPRTSIARADGYCVRQDWLDALKIDSLVEGEPLTLDELVEIATQFTYGDPDGNGIADTYGIAANCDSDGDLSVLFPFAFGLIGWQEYDGEYMNLQYSRTHDNFKRALTFTADLWAKGLVDPDWPTLSREISSERFQRGITGMYNEFCGSINGHEGYGRMLNEAFTVSYAVGVVEKEGDAVVGGNYGTGMFWFWSVTSACEQPARALGFLDYFLSDEGWPMANYGLRGVDWDMDENGEVYSMVSETNTSYRFSDILRRNNDPSKFLGILPQGATEEEVQMLKRKYNLLSLCIANNVFSMDMGYVPPIASDPTLIDYNAYMEQQISKIIVGDVPVDAWDEILDGWYEAGGTEYVAQVQAYIASIN